jgi:RimJ/RimL family protein N-acetyltransferase
MIRYSLFQGVHPVSDLLPLLRHRVILYGETAQRPEGCQRAVRLRPLTERDWPRLYRWNSDPEVLYFSEGDDVDCYSPEDVQGIYRTVSQTAFCFIIEVDGTPVGECWLQRMNIVRILEKYPGLDCRRIDLMIGEKAYWGQGIGTETIRLLTEFGFLHQGADVIHNAEIADYNVRSWRAFQRLGYRIAEKIQQPPGSKAEYGYDLVLTREAFFAQRRET